MPGERAEGEERTSPTNEVMDGNFLV
jgi:hypothetical protein